MLNFKNKTELDENHGFYIFDDVLDNKYFKEISKQFSKDKEDYGSKGWNGKRVSIQFGTKNFEGAVELFIIRRML